MLLVEEMPVTLAKAHAVFVLPDHLKVDCAVAGKVKEGMCTWWHPQVSVRHGPSVASKLTTKAHFNL